MFVIQAMIFILSMLGSDAHADPLKGNKYLRAVALDLLGRPPTPEEYALMGSGTELPLELLDQWLDSNAFLAETTERHRKLFWNRLESRTFNSESFGLQYTRVDNPIFYSSNAERASELTSHPYSCEDYESSLDENGISVDSR